jgi:hypothetical protein
LKIALFQARHPMGMGNGPDVLPGPLLILPPSGALA